MSDIDLPPVGQRLAQGDLDRMVQRVRKAQEWQASVSTLTGEGRGAEVLAVVDARGVLRSLDIPDVACRGRGHELASDVVEAIRAARADVAEKLARSGRLAFGEDAPEVDTIAVAAAARSRAPIVADGGDDPEAPADDADRGFRSPTPPPPPAASHDAGTW